MNVTNPDQRDKVICYKNSELSKIKQQNTCETWKYKKTRPTIFNLLNSILNL